MYMECEGQNRRLGQDLAHGAEAANSLRAHAALLRCLPAGMNEGW